MSPEGTDASKSGGQQLLTGASPPRNRDHAYGMIGHATARRRSSAPHHRAVLVASDPFCSAVRSAASDGTPDIAPS
jgi:hypothetical protein